MTRRFQFCWYGWRAWRRLFFERWEPRGYGRIYKWRLAVGPLDIRRWLPDFAKEGS